MVGVLVCPLYVFGGKGAGRRSSYDTVWSDVVTL